jgi:hypothetical protein|tara:strand:+ start:323 stop:475 length:153 start_codon:yes stop_codon:yes gene_type:complete
MISQSCQWQAATRWIGTHKLDHFAKASTIKKMVKNNSWKMKERKLGNPNE